MNEINIIFPHQLFQENPLFNKPYPIYLIEEELFFNQYPFHKQKIAFHRATMKSYEALLLEKGKTVHYIDATQKETDIRVLVEKLGQQKIKKIHFVDPTDDWLETRLIQSASEHNIELQEYSSPLFLNSKEDLSSFFKKEKKKFFQTKFYIQQRKKRKILVDKEDKALGGKWSFDAENRKKYPAKKLPPSIHFPDSNKHFEEAKEYTLKHFANNIGALSQSPLYPFNKQQTDQWLHQFLVNRFHEFGTYEDAIVKEHGILNHSVLTPMLNVGLITPQEILDAALDYAKENEIPINSTEGFVRQIIGWREFIRGIYQVKGRQERSTNFWQFKRKIPRSFYDGTTGIPPVDTTIRKVLKTGYCHHIERLMILGNFMLLCEFDPDEVYKWFMEFFIDSYDWVMVPNVYGMSQFADGGLLSTKPYISGSNYVIKMSNYKKGEWQGAWDGLFWRFMNVHRDFFLSNPRLGMLVRMFDKMPVEKQNLHMNNADEFFKTLS